MVVICPHCRQPVEIPATVPPGQPVGCPFCRDWMVVPAGPTGPLGPVPFQPGFPGPQPQQGGMNAPWPPYAPFPPAGAPSQQQAGRSYRGVAIGVAAGVVLAALGGIGTYLVVRSGGSAATATGPGPGGTGGPAASGAAGGGSPATGTRAPATTDLPAPNHSRMILLDATRFREAAVIDFNAAIAMYGVGTVFAPLATRPRHREEPALWPLFFAGALTLLGDARSDRPIVCFYNPLFDGALLTTWDVQGGNPRITGLGVRAGSDLSARGDPSGVPARWRVSPRPLPDGLAEQVKAFVADFEAAYPADGDRPAEIPAPGIPPEALDRLEGQVFVALTQLRLIHDASVSQVGPLLRSLRRSLAKGDAGALAAALPPGNVVSAEDLLKLPVEMRTGVRPIYAVVSDEKLLVLLAATATPRVLGAYEFTLAGGKADPRSLVFFDVTAPKGEG